MEKNSNHPKLVYLLLICIWFAGMLTFAPSLVPGGLDVDSCNYAVVAKEVLRTNNWLQIYDPVYRGIFYSHFPICIWMTALFFKLFTVTSFTAKLFSMICGLILVGTVFYTGRVLKNYWVGFFAALGLMMTNHVARLTMQCRMDIPVTLFISLAILAFILAQKKSKKYYLLFGLFTSLAILTKDLFGLFPLAIVSIYLVFGRRWREFFNPLFISGILVAALPVLIWIWLDKGVLFNSWFNWNFMHLYKSPSFNVPWHYYITALLDKYFYFLPLALYGGYLAVREARETKRGEFYLLIIWAVIFPLAFSFGRQKLHYFILPIYPATSLLLGLAVDKFLSQRAKVGFTRVFGILLIVGTAAMLFFPVHQTSKRCIEAVKMTPVIDRVLKDLPDYEFVLYRYDQAATLFYSQELTKLTYFDDQSLLEKSLSARSQAVRVCFIPREEYQKLSAEVQGAYRPILKYKRMLLLVEKKGGEGVIATLP